MAERAEDRFLRVFDARLAEHGDSAQGAYWPNEVDRRTRFDVMLDMLAGRGDAPVVLCDLGCGTGELLAHIRRLGLTGITYIGVDRSQTALALARAKFPDATFVNLDVTDTATALDALACDYLVANGLFTARFGMAHAEMWDFLRAAITRVWPHVRRGLAFNVMSKAVAWERDDLFHLPMDDAARFLHGLAGRRVRLRADYGLYEYTAIITRPEPIPVLRPLLPAAERLLPYLQRIDASRVYTNHGRLLAELETRLAVSLALPRGGLAGAGSGTAAIVGAIFAAAGRATAQKPLALMPGFTFVATAVAAEQCGYTPYFADIDAATWLLDPAALSDHPVLARIGVVIPVAALGRPVPQAPWAEFSRRTAIPVVIDGASSFDRITPAPAAYLGSVPVALSFHASKAFGMGEAGGVACTDLALMENAVQAMNFGFRTARDSLGPSINGKMSEYHAAVGLAACDTWPQKQAALQNVIELYAEAFADRGLASHFIGAPAASLSYAIFQAESASQAQALQASLRAEAIDTRLWYGTGLHRQTHYAGATRDPLPVTERIAACLIGLPMAPDLPTAQIRRVATEIAAALKA